MIQDYGLIVINLKSINIDGNPESIILNLLNSLHFFPNFLLTFYDLKKLKFKIFVNALFFL